VRFYGSGCGVVGVTGGTTAIQWCGGLSSRRRWACRIDQDTGTVRNAIRATRRSGRQKIANAHGARGR
jgi:hypothetical protein